MTDLVASVRLKADGSGVVGQVREAAAALSGLKAETAAAAAPAATLGTAGRSAAAGLSEVAAAAAGAAAGAGAAARAAVELGAAGSAASEKLAQMARQILALETAVDAGAGNQARLTAELAGSRDIVDTLTAKIRTLEAALGKAGGGLKSVTASAGQQRAGMQQLSFQLNDIATSFQGGISPMTIFAQQASQVTQAIGLMQGEAKGLLGFLGGPWGAVLTAAAVVLTPLVGKLFEAGEAADAAKAGADGLSEAQGVLGRIFDLTSGKLEHQNELLRLNARLTSINLRGDALKERNSSLDTFGKADQVSYLGLGSLATGKFGNEVGAAQRQLLTGLRSGKLTAEQALRKSEAIDFSDVKITKEQFQQALIDSASATAKERVADLIDQSLDSSTLAAELKKPDTRKPKDLSKAKAALGEFGRDALTRIAELGQSFTDTPSQVDKVNRALAQLDDLVDDIARKKPPGFEKLLADARAARSAIEQGIDEPYRNFLETQTQSLEIGRLAAAGREDEADALKIIYGLERQMGPLSAARKDAVLATVEAIRAEQRETEILRKGQEKYLDALDQVRSAVQGIFTDGAQGLKDLPGRIVGAFQQLAARDVFEKLFGDAFQKLDDQVRGVHVVENASERMADAVDAVSGSLDRLGRAADAAAGREAGGGAGAGVKAGGEFFSGLFGSIGGAAPPDSDDIVVTAPTKRKVTPESFFSDALVKLAKGVGISDAGAAKIGEFGGKAIKGAAEGALANSVFSPIAKGLGIKTSGTGAQFGGAAAGLANALGAGLGPLAPVISGVIGSVVGGLLKSTPSGKVTLTSTSSDTTATGNSASARAAATGVAKSVQDGIRSIADQLGGTLGSFAVTVGQRHGDYRVTTGTSLKKKNGAEDFDGDADAATARAIQIAITQGAVQGLSAAVQKAIGSSSDINRALQEALDVQNLEDQLGGLASALQAPFRTAEKEAKERLRLATAYGLDIVKVEALNGKKRAEVLDQVLAQRLSALKGLAADLAYGDLYEGSPAEQRGLLAQQAAQALSDAEAGIEGATDKYAALVRQLLAKDKDVFGTAGGEYAGDRADAVANISRLEQLETDRVKAAQADAQKLTAAAVQTNTLLDENSDQNAEMLSALAAINASILRLGTGGNALVPDYSSVARVAL